MAMHATASSAQEERDQRVILHGLSWKDYEAILAMRGDRGGLRLTYLEGSLEIMAPARYHERDKKTLARLLEAYAAERSIELEGYGSWTVKNEAVERGAEPDECYVLGLHDIDALLAPDIAIEVVFTSGGLPKLEVWRKPGAREVWFWKEARLSFHLLRGEHYVEATRSERLPELDPALIERCMAEPTQSAAVRSLREALRAG